MLLPAPYCVEPCSTSTPASSRNVNLTTRNHVTITSTPASSRNVNLTTRNHVTITSTPASSRNVNLTTRNHFICTSTLASSRNVNLTTRNHVICTPITNKSAIVVIICLKFRYFLSISLLIRVPYVTRVLGSEAYIRNTGVGL